jgi:thiopurine S-methyltransferase
MDKNFWINAWEEGRTGFHQQNFHPKLVQYFPKLSPHEGQRVFVPLCGKTHDMLWLLKQGLKVQGVELYEGAVAEFFDENNLPAPKIQTDGAFKNYLLDDITISVGDIFAFPENDPFDFIYDRAALVALPEYMRKDYAKKITCLIKPQGKMLLITYEYHPEEMMAPPFSVPDEEIQKLYAEHFSIQLLESEKPKEGTRLDAVPSLTQNVYLLQRKT